MKKVLSLCLWVIGSLFFSFSAVMIILCMFTLSKHTTYKIIRILFRIQIYIMGIKLEVFGQEYIRHDKPYLIMGNHQSLFDVFVIPAAIPEVFVGVEASYHFSFPIWGYLTRKWGNIPIERNNLKKAIASLKIARDTLASGVNIAILPEGHRTQTGKLMPFKKGPFHLAKSTKADILPFCINGLFDYNKKNTLIINPGMVTVNIGKPIEFETIKDLSVEELRDTVFNHIHDLNTK